MSDIKWELANECFLQGSGVSTGRALLKGHPSSFYTLVQFNNSSFQSTSVPATVRLPSKGPLSGHHTPASRPPQSNYQLFLPYFEGFLLISPIQIYIYIYIWLTTDEKNHEQMQQKIYIYIYIWEKNKIIHTSCIAGPFF